MTPAFSLNESPTRRIVPVVRRLDAAPDPAALVQQLAPAGDAILFESGRHHPATGRYSFLALAPRFSVIADRTGLRIVSADGVERPQGSPVALLRALLARDRSPWDSSLPPFTGGFAGYLSYDARVWFERVPQRAHDDLGLPLFHWTWWDSVVAIDHLERCTWVMVNPWPAAHGQRADDAAAVEVERLAQGVAEAATPVQPAPTAGDATMTPSLRPQMTRQAFETMVRRAQAYIRDGDIYQVNLSQRFSGAIGVDPWTLYATLRTINPSPFACFARLGDVVIASCSPERLLRIQGDVVETRPIAGTRPRGHTPEADLDQTVELILSDKERAEHIMLVDLERNDVGRVCDYHSVRVDELMVLEEYSHVRHIVSNVRGRLRPTADRLDALAAVFPGGTITGTPKVRAMEIIDELESVARGPYTGTIGYVGANGAADLNILIRTFVIAHGQAHVQVGAGIVADSDPGREYAETLAKGAALFAAFRQAHAPRHVVEQPALAG